MSDIKQKNNNNKIIYGILIAQVPVVNLIW